MLAILLNLIIVIVFVGISIMLSFVNSFLNHIDVVDSGMLGLVAGIALYLANRQFQAPFPWQAHPAVCLICGVAVFVVTLLLQKTSIGFWIFAVVFSLFWALLFAVLAKALAGFDMVWFWTVFAGVAVVSFLSHLRASH